MYQYFLLENQQWAVVLLQEHPTVLRSDHPPLPRMTSLWPGENLHIETARFGFIEAECQAEISNPFLLSHPLNCCEFEKSFKIFCINKWSKPILRSFCRNIKILSLHRVCATCTHCCWSHWWSNRETWPANCGGCMGFSTSFLQQRPHRHHPDVCLQPIACWGHSEGWIGQTVFVPCWLDFPVHYSSLN